jgi:hypothetical protein
LQVHPKKHASTASAGRRHRRFNRRSHENALAGVVQAILHCALVFTDTMHGTVPQGSN